MKKPDLKYTECPCDRYPREHGRIVAVVHNNRPGCDAYFPVCDIHIDSYTNNGYPAYYNLADWEESGLRAFRASVEKHCGSDLAYWNRKMTQLWNEVEANGVTLGFTDFLDMVNILKNGGTWQHLCYRLDPASGEL